MEMLSSPSSIFSTGPADRGVSRFLLCQFSAVVLLCGGAFTAGAATIINDTFTGTDGSALSAHSPDTNLTGHAWASTATRAISIQSNAVSVTGYGNAAIDITSNGGYTKPVEMTLSASINLADTVDRATAWDLVGLGFFSALSTGQSFWQFSGLTIRGNGTLVLQHFNEGSYSPTVAGSVAYVGTWDQTVAHTLTYTINTDTGNISDISFLGSTADYSGLSTSFFTGANTNLAGLYLQNGNSSGTISVDNFSLTTAAVPEPATAGLFVGMVIGVAALSRRRRRDS